MRITVRDVQTKWPNATDIKQIDRKQLFTAVIDGHPCLISYKTIVGYLLHENYGTGLSLGRIWHLTPAKHSRTTSKQLTQFARGRVVKWCDSEEWEALNK